MSVNKNKVLWWRNSFGQEELKKINESFLNENISMGPITKEFEVKFAKALNVPYAVATTSGSVALLMSMMAFGIGKGDEIIVPNRTWIATAHAPQILGAKVVLVDVMPDTPILDVSQVRKKITSKTKAIIPVHLNGISVDMKEIQKIADEYNLKVVEDASQALFSKNSKGFLGTQSDAGCFSLAVTKLISTGQGGLIVTKNKEIYEKLKLIRWHGTEDNINPKYKIIGCNFKFTDLQASIGIVQLSRTQEKINRVNEIYAKYSEAISSLSYIKMIPVKVSKGEVPQYVEVLSNERQKLMDFLTSQNIETRPSLPNLNSAPYLKSTEIFPNSEIFRKQGLYLPCGPAQSLENVDRVIKLLKSYDVEK